MDNTVEHKIFHTKEDLAEFLKVLSTKDKLIVLNSADCIPSCLPKDSLEKPKYFISLSDTNKIIEYSPSDLVVSVEAGISLQTLQDFLLPYQQFLPVNCFNKHKSLLELVLINNVGPLEHGFGNFRTHILGMQVALTNGSIIKCGGKVVKNVTGYDLSKLFIGTHGLYGLPVTLNLRLSPYQKENQTVCVGLSLDRAFQLARSLRLSSFPANCLELISAPLFKQFFFNTYNDESISDLLSKDTQTYLIIQTPGSAEVVAKLNTVLKNIISDHYYPLTTHAQEVFFQALSYADNLGHYELNNQNTTSLVLYSAENTLEKIIHQITHQHKQLFWFYRPGSHRLVITNLDNDQLTAIQHTLLSISNTDNTKIVCGQANNKFLFELSYLPDRDPLQKELCNRLKLSFDPNNILNPVVAL